MDYVTKLVTFVILSYRVCTLLNAAENTLPLKTQKEPDRYPIPKQSQISLLVT